MTQEHNIKLLQNTIDPSWGSEISQMINSRQKNNESKFAVFWSKLCVFIHTYNFFTCFFFIGIPGYPSTYWFALEVFFEMITVIDFAVRWLFRTKFTYLWNEMYLLHDQSPLSKSQFTLRMIGVIPQTIILSSCLYYHQDTLNSLTIACLRLVKLFGFDQVKNYFRVIDFRKRSSSSYSMNKAFFAFYYMILFCHFIACLWLMTGRLDPAV